MHLFFPVIHVFQSYVMKCHVKHCQMPFICHGIRTQQYFLIEINTNFFFSFLNVGGAMHFIYYINRLTATKVD